MKLFRTQRVSPTLIDTENSSPTSASDLVTSTIVDKKPSIAAQDFWSKWFAAFKHVLPIYMIMRIVFFLLTYFSALFSLDDFSTKRLPIYTLWQAWARWDAGHYIFIAQSGYDAPWRTAFFPLFPLLQRGVAFLTHSPLMAGLIIANLANLLMLVIFYQLVKDDFDHERAIHSVLYMSVFPSAFFLAAAYNESLFICLMLLGFYQIRHGHWWLAGLLGFFACLTRSAGSFLLFPFCYEYLRQHQFSWKRIRFDVLSAGLLPAGVGVYAWYCYHRFGDFFSFMHAQANWYHQFHFPWDTLILTLRFIKHGTGLLSFQTLHNFLDLLPILFVLAVIILCFVGPWRLPRTHLVYGIYAVPLSLFLLSFPIIDTLPVPLQSVPRFMLEVFPAFIVAAALSKYRLFHNAYLIISGSLLFTTLTLYLVGHWVV